MSEDSRNNITTDVLYNINHCIRLEVGRRVNEELKRFRHFDGMTLSSEMYGILSFPLLFLISPTAFTEHYVGLIVN